MFHDVFQGLPICVIFLSTHTLPMLFNHRCHGVRVLNIAKDNPSSVGTDDHISVTKRSAEDICADAY